MPPFLDGVWVHADGRGDGHAKTRLFWLPEYDPAVVTVHAEPILPSDFEAFDIAAFPDMTDVVMDGKGQELILLDDGAHQIELQVRSGTLSDGPVRLRCELNLFTGIEAKLLTVSRLNAFRRYGRFPISLFPPERRAPKWALALQAYDGPDGRGVPARDRLCTVQ